MQTVKNHLIAITALFCSFVASGTGSPQESPPIDIEYVRITNERAQKIVSRLELMDSEKELRVRDQIAIFYRGLHSIHNNRDTKLKLINETKNGDQATRDSQAIVRSDSEAEQFRLHYAFVAKLATELSGDQIDQVKNGLTYEVVPKTYQQYLKLHPNLTEEQQRTILGFLLEAREHAMDAGSSEEKHGVFGKYKGRINNFLSAQRFDAKQAERDLKARQ